MQIVPYRDEYLTGVYDAYLRATGAVPHCRFTPSLEYTGAALTRAEQAGAGLLVAEDGGAVHGIATLRPIATAEDGLAQLEITGLFAPEEATVVALLEACMQRAHGARRVLAFAAEHDHCPLPAYNAGWNGLSDRMPWVARVLARHGFVPTYRELHLECAAAYFPSTQLPAPPGITLVEGTRAETLSVRAMEGDQELGLCLYFRLRKLSDHPEAGAWAYVDWLGVDEAHRRRGLGRCLMSLMLTRLREQAYHGCWLTTGGDNWPAQPLYLGLGFEILDTSSSWEKSLPAG